MRLEITKERVFIPEFNGNKILSGTDQITVRYRTPTVAIKNRCRRKPQAKAIADTAGSIRSMELLVERDEQTTLNEMLVSISNCSYSEAGGKDHYITNANELVNAPLAFEPLLKEIIAEFDRALDTESLSEKN